MWNCQISIESRTRLGEKKMWGLYSPDEGDLLTTAVVTQELAQYAFSDATSEATEHALAFT